jgi:predicted ATPase/DNA-binding CsgD family transcriptional regulator
MPFPNNLPQELTSFVGRRREMAEVRRLLPTTRLLTLTGAGGCGKTRLALRVASHALKEYLDGVWFVDLASLADVSLVPQAVASALGVREQTGRTLMETLTEYLKPKKLLLVLDNCEHLVEACASLVDALLHDCTNLRILATSRQPLSVTAETTWRVPSLSLPDPLHLPALKELGQYDAVRLFARRAQFRRENFEVTPANAAPIVQLCHQLDGIPLAVELAAARMSVLSVEEIASRIDERFRLLTSPYQTAMPRHRTLQATLDWSYNLLFEAEQSLLRSLSVFTGGFTVEAVEAVCGREGEIDEYETLDLLVQLVDKSLVIMEVWDGKSRYRLLETVRQYSLVRLNLSGEVKRLRDRHLDYYLAVAEEAEPQFQQSNQSAWLERLEMEHDNLRAALGWSVNNDCADGAMAEAGMRLAAALWWFWHLRGYWSEGIRWLTDMLALDTGDVSVATSLTTARAKGFNGAGRLALIMSDYASAATLLEEGLALSRRAGYKQGAAASLFGLSMVAFDQGKGEQTKDLAEEALAIGREVDDKLSIANALKMLGYAIWKQGDIADARSKFEEGLLISRALGNEAVIANMLMDLGEIARAQKDYDRAGSLNEEALALHRKLMQKRGIATALMNLGIIACHQRDYQVSENLFTEGILLLSEIGGRNMLGACLMGLAGVWAIQGQAERAATLFGAADAMCKSMGIQYGLVDRSDFDSSLIMIQAQLTAEVFNAAWARGQTMSTDEAVAFALQRPSAVGHISEPLLPDGDYPKDLTKREAELLGLVAGGLTNKEIAGQLSISVYTVETHLRSIFGKLGVTTRNAASRFAIDLNLV